MSTAASPAAVWLADKRVVVLLGAGGVGKTTSAISLALLGAKQGRRVALLSIDPAKRLAAALGIPLGHQLRRLELPESVAAGGTVDAAMLDQKAVFDAMVARHAPSAEVRDRILAHPIYKAASSNLSGPLEYMALAKLQELDEDAQYDLIVLDTPPDTHALDFLARPNVLAGFMENKVMSWLIKPFAVAGRLGLGRVLSFGERLMGGVAQVTGVGALHAFAEFLLLMQEVIAGFHRSGERIVKTLRRADTGFFLVTVPTRAAARSAANIAQELRGMGYRCGALLFNRCVPEPVKLALSGPNADGAALSVLHAKVRGEAEVKRSLVAHLTSSDTPDTKGPMVLSLEEQDHDLGDLAALVALTASLAGPLPQN